MRKERENTMKFREFGDINKKTIILLHGGGLSWWSLQNVIDKLKNEYYIITPIIDGYGEDAEEDFISIENSARKLIHYIDTKLGGSVFTIGGLSIGAQIVTEVISNRKDIAQYAILESALVCPIAGTEWMTVPACKMSYGLIKKRWFSKLQAKELCVPKAMFEKYYEDSIKISKQSLIQTILSNGTYQLKGNISETKAKVLILVGEKEVKQERKSAQLLHTVIPDSKLIVIPNLKHGEYSLKYTEKYCETLRQFVE